MKLSLALAAALAVSAEAGLLRQRQLSATTMPCYNPTSTEGDGSNCNNQVLTGAGATSCAAYAVKTSKGKDKEEACTITCKEPFGEFELIDNKGQDKQNGPILYSDAESKGEQCPIAIDGTDFEATECTNWDAYASQLSCEPVPGYCFDAFCYVDPENCDRDNSKSNFFEARSAMEVTVDGLFFSYATCDGKGDGPGKKGCPCINSAAILEEKGVLCDFNGQPGAETDGPCGCLPLTYGSGSCGLYSLDEPGCGGPQ